MNIVVTGASAGIGYETVVKLSQNGHHVVAIARREEALLKLKNECERINPLSKVTTLAADVSGLSANDLFTTLKMAGFECVDALLNNAGLLINKPFTSLDKTDWLRIYEVNVFAVASMVKMLYPFLKASQMAHIVNISSMGGVGGTSKFAGLSAYSSSKGALAIMTECMAEEFKVDDIKVNALALGAVQTEMLAAAFPGYKAPLTAIDMADYVSWFLQNGQKYFNGKVLPVALNTI